MSARLEPGPETITGKPVYVVWSDPPAGDPGSVELRAADRLVVAIPFRREGSVLKAEIVNFSPGEYRVVAAGDEFNLTVREAPSLGFLTEFGWTVFAVAMAFAIGLSWRARFRGKKNAEL